MDDDRDQHERDDDTAKNLIFRAMVWAVGILLTVTGITVGYLYRSNQEAIATSFQEIHEVNSKQWDRISLMERRLDAIEWLAKQNQVDLAAMKGRHP